MTWLFAITGIFGIWAFLSLLGGERARRIRELEIKLAIAAAEAAKAAGAAEDAAIATPTVR